MSVGIRLKPVAEAVLRVPSHGHGKAEARDVCPASIHLMGQPKRFNVEENFACQGRERGWALSPFGFGGQLGLLDRLRSAIVNQHVGNIEI